MSTRRIYVGGDLEYLERLIEMYGLNIKIRTVWELEMERLSLIKVKKEMIKRDESMRKPSREKIKK